MPKDGPAQAALIELFGADTARARPTHFALAVEVLEAAANDHSSLSAGLLASDTADDVRGKAIAALQEIPVVLMRAETTVSIDAAMIDQPGICNGMLASDTAGEAGVEATTGLQEASVVAG
eukprot:1160494-Pelagomonas_calceolata.AAC.2